MGRGTNKPTGSELEVERPASAPQPFFSSLWPASQHTATGPIYLDSSWAQPGRVTWRTAYETADDPGPSLTTCPEASAGVCWRAVTTTCFKCCCCVTVTCVVVETVSSVVLFCHWRWTRSVVSVPGCVGQTDRSKRFHWLLEEAVGPIRSYNVWFCSWLNKTLHSHNINNSLVHSSVFHALVSFLFVQGNMSNVVPSHEILNIFGPSFCWRNELLCFDEWIRVCGLFDAIY